MLKDLTSCRSSVEDESALISSQVGQVAASDKSGEGVLQRGEAGAVVMVVVCMCVLHGRALETSCPRLRLRGPTSARACCAELCEAPRYK